MTQTQPGSMLEKLARALAESMGDNYDHAHDSKQHWIATRGEAGDRFRDINEPRKPDYREGVRAMLQALRGPTPGMKLAGAEKITAQMCGAGPPADYDAAHDCWQAMLDAAMEGGS